MWRDLSGLVIDWWCLGGVEVLWYSVGWWCGGVNGVGWCMMGIVVLVGKTLHVATGVGMIL